MMPSLSLRVSQNLTLTPQLQQSIRLLQLSTQELTQEVEQMLDENPFLEREGEEAPESEAGKEGAESAEAADAADKAADTAASTDTNNSSISSPEPPTSRWILARARKPASMPRPLPAIRHRTGKSGAASCPPVPAPARTTTKRRCPTAAAST
jgi:hypothetical protein